MPPLQIEVQPNEKWSAGSNFPVQVFKAFNLPQDFNSYVDKTRDEIAERCLARGGRFLADIAHLVRDYRADIDRQWNEGGARELADLKNEKAVAERRVEELTKRVAECVDELKKLKLENEKMKEVAKSRIKEINELKERVVSGGKELDTMRGELSILKGANEVFEKSIADLKLDLEKSIADVAQGIGTGYQSCYDRLKEAGIDLSGHSFEDYCADLVKSLPNNADVVNPDN